MRKLTALLLLIAVSTVYSQVGIGTTDPKAQLDIHAVDPANPTITDGILLPRVDSLPTGMGVEQNGMMVFLTTDNTFYFWDNAAADWQFVNIKKLDDLADAKSDSDESNDGSSVFIGVDAGSNDDSSHNQSVGIGYQSLYSNTSGSYNTASGFQSLYNNTTGVCNTANGDQSLWYNSTGQWNTATGHESLFYNTTGNSNTANGSRALYYNRIGDYNTAFGHVSLQNTIGDSNTAIGYQSLVYNTTGMNNTASGCESLFSNTTGSYNTAIGYGCFYLGNYTNSTALGNGAQPNASNTIVLGNGVITSIGGAALWSMVSDSRFKKNVKENVVGLSFIKKLRPVTYQLDMDAMAKFSKTPDSLRSPESESLKEAEIQSGFIAQEVERAAESLNYDFHGVDKPKNENSHYGLRYAEFVVPLVKAVQEQNELIETLQAENQLKSNEIQALKLRLAQIESVLNK